MQDLILFLVNFRHRFSTHSSEIRPLRRIVVFDRCSVGYLNVNDVVGIKGEIGKVINPAYR
jgi:hypothetical protein